MTFLGLAMVLLAQDRPTLKGPPLPPRAAASQGLPMDPITGRCQCCSLTSPPPQGQTQCQLQALARQRPWAWLFWLHPGLDLNSLWPPFQECSPPPPSFVFLLPPPRLLHKAAALACRALARQQPVLSLINLSRICVRGAGGGGGRDRSGITTHLGQRVTSIKSLTHLRRFKQLLSPPPQ